MYRIRFIRIMFGCLFEKKKEILDTFDLHFWAIPFLDTDWKLFFTQTYGSYGGLGRWHYVFSSKFKDVALKNRWIPVTKAENTYFRKSIKAFEKVNLQTKILCWDERNFFLKQTFFVKGEERAVIFVEGVLRGPKGHLNPIETFKVLGLQMDSPSMPDEIRRWYSVREVLKSQSERRI